MPDDKKSLSVLVALSGSLISILLALNGFFLIKVFDKVEATYDRTMDATQRIAVLTARFDTYVQFQKGTQEGVTYGQSLRKKRKFHLVQGI